MQQQTNQPNQTQWCITTIKTLQNGETTYKYQPRGETPQ